MKQDLILAGVGGQGILTIAQAISTVAVQRGLYVKQAEVHGMSQRGGQVQSHLRISDRPIHSDLVPQGRADLLIAVEPLESLRYLQYLAPDGAAVVCENAFVNIGNYPPVESLLARVAELPRHVLVDADRLARAAGSGRATNIAALGAASLFLELDANELEEAVAQMLASKGERVVEVNRRAFRFGRNAAWAYRDALEGGSTAAAARHWIETLEPEHLASYERPDVPSFDVVDFGDRLSGAEVHAVEEMLARVSEEGRTQLFEHEVYQIVQLVGAISPPHHVFLRPEELLADDALRQFPGDQVVLKIVSPDITHKTEANGIAFVRKDPNTVRTEIDRLIARHRHASDVRGVLVVENVERVRPGFGNELFVGIRATREFGPVLAAGLGGIDTEYLADKMRPGVAVAKVAALETSAEEFLELFRSTAAYEILAGRARGRRRIVSDGELLRCFRAFLLLARKFCVDRGSEGPDVAELEVNPFAFRKQGLVPLDGRGRLERAARPLPERPREKVERLLAPRSLAVLGVSESERSFGRIILQNVLDCGFPREHLHVVKPGAESILDVPCVPRVADLPEAVDLLVLVAGAGHLPGLVEEIVESGKVEAAVLIAGGAGEVEGSGDIAADLRTAIAAGRARPGGGTVFLGPNSLGVLSKPGGYDTLFIPQSKVDKGWSSPARGVALVSQSGAFIVSRLSNLETLAPAFAVSIGNQIDLTCSDVVRALGRRDDVHTVGVYAEGFADLDGLALVRATAELRAQGKDVVFYKAGRTASGRSAAAGHTASVAGDYDVCQAAVGQAGALVASSFKEFEQLLELSTLLHERAVRGTRIGVVSNAGYETVGMADAVQGEGYAVQMAALDLSDRERLTHALAEQGLGGLVNVRNPVDLTPQANEAAYEAVVRTLLESPAVDAVVVGVVPLTPSLLTTPDEIGDVRSLAHRLPAIAAGTDKPLVVVVDSGALYEPFASALRAGDLPVFRSADQAIRSLGRYVCHRAAGLPREETVARPEPGREPVPV